MLKQYKNKTIVLIIIGFIIFSVPIGLENNSELSSDSAAFPILILLGEFFICLGCIYWTKGKGYNGAWGLLGTLNIYGIIALAFFRDKTKIKKMKEPRKNDFEQETKEMESTSFKLVQNNKQEKKTIEKKMEDLSKDTCIKCGKLDSGYYSKYYYGRHSVNYAEDRYTILGSSSDFICIGCLNVYIKEKLSTLLFFSFIFGFLFPIYFIFKKKYKNKNMGFFEGFVDKIAIKLKKRECVDKSIVFWSRSVYEGIKLNSISISRDLQ